MQTFIKKRNVCSVFKITNDSKKIISVALFAHNLETFTSIEWLSDGDQIDPLLHATNVSQRGWQP